MHAWIDAHNVCIRMYVPTAISTSMPVSESTVYLHLQRSLCFWLYGLNCAVHILMSQAFSANQLSSIVVLHRWTFIYLWGGGFDEP